MCQNRKAHHSHTPLLKYPQGDSHSNLWLRQNSETPYRCRRGRHWFFDACALTLKRYGENCALATEALQA